MCIVYSKYKTRQIVTVSHCRPLHKLAKHALLNTLSWCTKKPCKNNNSLRTIVTHASLKRMRMSDSKRK